MATLLPMLSDIAAFCELGGGLRLRSYQAEAARAILDSIYDQAGRSLVVLFPRQ
jgi:hypothetical protein